MDIYCPKCGEPWELDSLHEEVDFRKENDRLRATFDQVRKDFARDGCESLEAFGSKCGAEPTPVNKKRALISSVLFEVLGSDIDGVASEMDDAEALGLFGAD